MLDPADFACNTAQGGATSRYPSDTLFRLGLRLLLDGVTAITS